MTEKENPLLEGAEPQELLPAGDEMQLLVPGDSLEEFETPQTPPAIEDNSKESFFTETASISNAPLVQAKKKKSWWKIVVIIVILTGIGVGAWALFGKTEKFHFGYSIEKDGSGKYQEEMVNKAEKERSELDTMNRAKNERNAALCTLIETPSRKAECLDTVSALIATASGNLEGCKTLSNTGLALACHDTILMNQATANTEKKLCESISDQNSKILCIDTIEKSLLAAILMKPSVNASDCENFSETRKTECLSHITTQNGEELFRKALQTDDIATCDTIEDATLQSSCKNTILFKKAITTNDMSLCDTITDADKRNACLATLKARNENTLFSQYIAEGNMNGCLSLSNESLKTRCHDTVIITEVRKTRDTKSCDTLMTESMKPSCQSLGK